MTPSTSLASRTEVRKLARVLGTEPEALEGMDEATPEDLRTLREALSDELLEQERRAFERIVTLADKLPAAVSASLAPRVLGAPLAARTAALLPAAKATDLAGRLPATFLAEIAKVVDARHIEHVIGELTPQTIAEVAAELQRQEEWLVMGGLVSQVSPASLAAAVGVLTDEGLLRTGALLEDPDRLGEVVDGLDDARILAITELAAREQAWVELVGLGLLVPEAQRARVLAPVAAMDDADVAALRAAADADPDLDDALHQLRADAPPELVARLEV